MSPREVSSQAHSSLRTPRLLPDDRLFSPHNFEMIPKVFETIRSGDNAAFGGINLGILTQALKDFQVGLAKRGIELDTYEVIEDLYEVLAYPMSELEAYFQHLEKGEKPNINEKTAYIFAFFVTKKLDELKDVAKEIDEEYAQ